MGLQQGEECYAARFLSGPQPNPRYYEWGVIAVAVDVGDMDYFVSADARLGGTTDKWITLGTHSRNRDLYELWAVINLITPKTYAVNHVVRDSDTGNSLLMGHVTALKGASRFDVRSGWRGKVPDRMQVRGYCSYKIVIPPGKSFPGEKLLIDFNQDALRAMEHQADLIAIAHDVRLKQRRPIDLNDRELVANDYSRFHGWMSGGKAADAKKFFQDNGLVDFYWGLGGPGPQGSFGIYGSGGSTQGRPSRVNYPADRIELLKRISPPTMDVAYPVDLFVRRPAQVWNMPVERPFGKWSVLAVFNYTGRTNRTFTAPLDGAKDLRLDPNKEYIANEFWTKQLIGTFNGTFATRPLSPYDCDIYSIVEKQDRPVLISTSRHVRQMAFDIKDLAYDNGQRMLRGVSRAVAGDPHQLRIYVPDGFTAKRVELSGGLRACQRITFALCCWPPGRLARRERRAYPMRYVRSEQQRQRA